MQPTLRRVAQRAREAFALLNHSDDASILEEGRKLVRRSTKATRQTPSPSAVAVDGGTRRLPVTLEEATIAVADIASVLDLTALVGLTGGSPEELMTGAQASFGDEFDFEEFLAST